eukprot:TRINITY_DN3987_c0_g1_i1.p4 TRINITY_DN3987_c0_g1~~TRINITY_DN3987_c0_g1_i1.p4  ORF type:complete len:106 (+),score=9.22 TRINITY_DN3987_c0_g1_i1:252-569(+)
MQIEEFKILTVTHKKTDLREIGNFVVKTEDKTALRNRLEALKVRFHLDELLYIQNTNCDPQKNRLARDRKFCGQDGRQNGIAESIGSTESAFPSRRVTLYLKYQL